MPPAWLFTAAACLTKTLPAADTDVHRADRDGSRAKKFQNFVAFRLTASVCGRKSRLPTLIGFLRKKISS